jgi:GNAT superfamily N-acetyltransferase
MGDWPQWLASDYDPPKCTEISAVCTHPEFRGRGYARDLTTFLAAQILAAGKTPFSPRHAAKQLDAPPGAAFASAKLNFICNNKETFRSWPGCSQIVTYHALPLGRRSAFVS